MLNVKRVYLYFIGMLFLVFSLQGVLANSITYSLDRLAYSAQPILSFFLGGYGYTGYLLFERFLFFMIIFSITFIALSKTPFFEGQKKVVILLSVIIPLLSVRYLNFEWIGTILVSYQVFGIALTAFLPFVVYFFFLVGIAPNSAGVRKIGWILFICVYLGLYTTSNNIFYGEVYMWTALIAFVFLLFDGTIARTMLWHKIKGSGKTSIQDAEVSIRRKMAELHQDLTRGIINQKYYDDRMKELQKQQKALFKYTVS